MPIPYRLAIGQRSYSSWSLRGWLLLEKFGLPYETVFCEVAGAGFHAALAAFAPARTVPALLTPEGHVVLESLAIAEELASRHPEAGHWPADPAARACARSLAAEMHGGFKALRNHCPHNIRHAYAGFVPPPEALADLERLETLWSWARRDFGGDGPWLFGRYTAADAFFAPVAGRIAGYGLPVGPEAAAYVAAHLADPAYRRWRATGLAAGEVMPRYELDLPHAPWPGPAPEPARAVTGTEADNDFCPYSGKPVTHVLEYQGRRFGFCNALCRDKTALDPEVWPKFMALVQVPVA
jgi:glutathione S-transferase